jgi:solute carrier family 25 protein 34/35
VKDPVTGRVRGALYTNPFDCLWKTYKVEGIRGWYKGEWTTSVILELQLMVITGTTAHFARIFPHTVITLVANEVRFLIYSVVRGG